MKQLNFTDHAVSRNTDPQTSHDAAAKVSVQDREDNVLMCLFKHVTGTTKEIGERIGIPRDSFSPRMPSLVKKKLVRLTGDKRSGCRVFALTSKGFLRCNSMATGSK